MAFAAGLVLVVLFSTARVDARKTEDRQIKYAFYDITSVTIHPEADPVRDADCGEDCWYSFLLEPRTPTVLTEKRYTQLKDGPQTFVGLIPGVKYDVTVCRVDGDGQWPIMSDIVMYSPAKPEGLASTRQRCESRVCRAYPQPLNTMYWCGYAKWLEI